MEMIRKAPLQLCARCFNFVQIKPIGTSCSLCWSLGSTTYEGKGITVLSRKFSFSSICGPDMLLKSRYRCRSLPVKRYFLSPFGNYRFSTCSMLQQTTFIRNFANQAAKPPNPLPPRKKSKGDSQKSPISWRNLMIVAGIGGALLLGMSYVKKEKEQEKQKVRNRKMGKAKLGGDWTLIDHHGKVRSSRDFLGQWVLIYFGFTNCPDICPEEIEKIVSVISKTDADSDLPRIQPILITVDPERDTPEALKQYCAEFSPRLLGFSGSQEQIHTATRAYRVYYSMGPKDEDNDYIVDHSIISYLVNPQGDFVDYFGQNKKDEEIYKSIKLHIMSYDKQNK